MTKRERAQVVELLRCAADGGIGLVGTCEQVGVSVKVKDTAWDAYFTTPIDLTRHNTYHDAFVHTFLEAAARVEEGSWP